MPSKKFPGIHRNIARKAESLARGSIAKMAGLSPQESEYLYEFIIDNWKAHKLEGLRDGLHALQVLGNIFPPKSECAKQVHDMMSAAQRVEYDASTYVPPKANSSAQQPQTGAAQEISTKASQLAPGESITVGDATITRSGPISPERSVDEPMTDPGPTRA